MNSIGETLRRERLRRNLDLDQISRELKISSRFLEAIEDERFDKLPAGVFAKSFVRQYARLLELDEEELAAQVQRAIEPESLPVKPIENWQPQVQEIHVPRVEEWEAVSDRGFRWPASLPALALVVVVMLVCSGVYSFWQRTRHPATARATAPAQVVQQPAKQQAPAAQPPAQEPAAQPPAAQEPVKPAPAETASAQPPASRQPEAQPTAPPANAGTAQREQNPAETPPNPADQKAVDPAAANPTGNVRVELTADEPVWVLARADGKYLFSGTLEPNQTRVVEASGTLMLRLGNAGGVNITLNGKPIGTVGAKGQVRDVQFTSGGFHIVAAPKPSLPLVEEPI
jgi:cytoskeleton protein RodZ